MFDFYITTDLKTSKICIAPTEVSAQRPFLIEFDSLWEAENYLKKLNFNKIPGPTKEEALYEKVRVEKGPLGEVVIFRVKNN